MSTDTPRSDAAAIECCGNCDDDAEGQAMVSIRFARQLERELSARRENVPREPTHRMVSAGRHMLAMEDSIIGAWRAMYDAALSTAPEPAGERVGVRTDTDYAIEHAEYMAQDAEQLLTAINGLQAAILLREESDADDGNIENTEESLSDACKAMRSGIYEFRKRRDRAKPTAEPAAQGENGPTGDGCKGYWEEPGNGARYWVCSHENCTASEPQDCYIDREAKTPVAQPADAQADGMCGCQNQDACSWRRDQVPPLRTRCRIAIGKPFARGRCDL